MPKIGDLFKESDGRKDKLNRKDMLRDYIDEEVSTAREFCTHQLRSDEEFDLPIKNNKMLGQYLKDLIEEGMLEDRGKGYCWKSYRHPKYKKIPAGERGEARRQLESRKKLEEKIKMKDKMVTEKPTQKNVFNAITSRFSEGDRFKSTEILKLWSGKKRLQASGSLYNLYNVGLLEKVDETRVRGKKTNVYELKDSNYEDRKKTEKKEKVYECPYCDYTTTEPQGLGGHMAQNHRDRMETTEEEEITRKDIEEEKEQLEEVSGKEEPSEEMELTFRQWKELLILEILRELV